MWLLLLPACKGVDPAPSQLDGLLHWVWQGYDDQDDASLAGGLVNLDKAIHAKAIDGPEDGTVSRLSDDEIAQVGITDQEADKAVGIYILNSFECDWGQLKEILSYPQQDELYDDGTYDAYARTFDDGQSRDAWLSGDQPRLDYDIDYTASLLGTSFDDHSRGALRTIPDQGKDTSPFGEFLIQRSYAKVPAEYDGDSSKSMNQDYQLELYWVHGAHIKHAYGIWRQASFGSGLDMENTTSQRLLLNGLEKWDETTAQDCADGKPSIVLFGVAFAGKAASETVAVPEYVTAARARVDWTIAAREAVDLLSRYLQVDTVNPPGNEDRGVDFLGAFLDQEGISWERVPLSDGRSSLIARLGSQGKGPPLCLMSHLDVVPAEANHWPADSGPLSGAVKDGYLWGRGAVDMKGMGALEVLTIAWLHRSQLPLDRDVVLLAVADEEVDNQGARSLTDSERWKSLGCGEMINEGGLGIQDALFDGQAVHAISTAEKGILWVRMTAEGRPGHGSIPRGMEEAPERLLAAMDALHGAGGKFVLVPEMRELMSAIGKNKGGIAGLVLKTPPLRRLFAWGALKHNVTTRAAMHDTVHLTGMAGANEPNVVPGSVSALLDCRLMPGTTPDAELDYLRERVLKVPGISFEVMNQGESNSSPEDDPLYRAIAKYAVEGRPYAVAGPLLSIGYTDSLVLRPLGVHAYGYIPFELPSDVAESQHSNNERVPVDQVGEGLRRLFSIVVEVAGSP